MNSSKKYIFIFLFLFSFLQSQNLVPNPSFEERKGKKFTFKPWQKINTIDFYANAPDFKEKNVNPNKNYKTYLLRSARTGYAYAGLRVWPRYHEFLVVELKRPLKAGKAYSFEMYVTPSRYANCYLKTLGASFYSSKINYSKRDALEHFPPQIQLFMPYGIRPLDSSEWIRINGVFIAKGGEKYLTIGCFTPQSSKKLKKKHFSLRKRDAYYYVDDIALYELDDAGLPILDSTKLLANKIAQDSISKNFISENIKTDSLNNATSTDSLVDVEVIKDQLPEDLKNIYFDRNSAKIKTENYRKLAVVVEFLLENPVYSIIIRGFASPGEYNGKELLLAEKRAKAVSSFLSGNRISSKRIIVDPIGVQCPYELINQKKEEKCQRVELILKK
jgi:outer membrane protein OmpA-like peptidoglycan-associated protein